MIVTSEWKLRNRALLAPESFGKHRENTGQIKSVFWHSLSNERMMILMMPNPNFLAAPTIFMAATPVATRSSSFSG